MAKPAHVRVTFEGLVGSVAAPLEHWAFGLNFPHDAIDGEGNDTVDNAIAEACAYQYDLNIKPKMTTDTILTRCTVARIDGTGHYELRSDGSFVRGEWNGSIPGVTAIYAVPLQTAVCVSLKTARSGPTGRGRFFLPYPGFTLESATRRVSAAETTALATSAKNFLNGLATELTFPPQVVSSKGYMSPVTAVRVGRAPDTMRSRRADVPEEYVTTNL